MVSIKPMNIEVANFLKDNIRCPSCHSPSLSFSHQLECNSCHTRYPISTNGCPVMIQGSNEVFSASAYLDSPQPSHKHLSARLIPNPSVNLSRVRNLQTFAKFLQEFETAYILVVGGGQQKVELEQTLSQYANLRFIYTDIDTSASVDVFCDGHDIPFRNFTFHGIITTAVLEHVLYPERVASEMHRVLIEGGVLYSEIPFMQQVHEGAYDFTRYTLSGHRRLLNGFSELQSGLVAGPATTLVWSIERFALCFTTGRKSALVMKAIVRILFFWIKYLDYLIQHNPNAMDGASCTYFLGKKLVDRRVPDQDIIEGYIGAVNLRHV